ncbi:Phosphatidylinositol-3-phosphatase SAC1 [Gnomoniopsis sp. IMI 355080]|nr:Phosphatidylinositol-3-phosphatase SAC1 [Gnomoniopsis sp. IMI 355080]
MVLYDVEALLDETAKDVKMDDAPPAQAAPNTSNGDDSHPSNGRDDISSDRRSRDDKSRDRGDRDKDRDRSRDRRRRDRSRDRYGSRRGSPDSVKTPRSETGSHRSSRRRSRSRDDHRDRHSRRGRGGGDGDYYRGGRGGGGRSRSRSPGGNYYRPRDDRRDYRDRRDRRGGDEDHRRGGGRTPRADRPEREKTPPALTEDERDRRTVFVQQLAARLRTRDLKEFFEKIGPVSEAQIVKDRVSNRSKGVGYVEFKNEESVAGALQLTGQKLLGIPVIVQLTEAEKNRQVRESGTSGGHPNSIPFHRLYVGNIHFSITEQDLQNVFEPFGELEFTQLQKDDTGRSRGYGFVQFRDAGQAREALEKMNGFDLAGRPIRVGLGNDKFTPESTANLLQRFQGQNHPQFQGSAFSGAGGRGAPTSNFDRAGARDNEKGGGASALDDTDVAGVNFNNYSRDALMRKLARTDEPPAANTERQILKPKTEAPKPMPITNTMASRCVVLHNMFDPDEEEGDNWVKELEDDVRGEAESKYGHVVHISVDPNSKGDIYLKFDKVSGGENAIKGLNGRYFGGRMITAAPVVDAVYTSLFRANSKAF